MKYCSAVACAAFLLVVERLRPESHQAQSEGSRKVQAFTMVRRTGPGAKSAALSNVSYGSARATVPLAWTGGDPPPIPTPPTPVMLDISCSLSARELAHTGLSFLRLSERMHAVQDPTPSKAIQN